MGIQNDVQIVFILYPIGILASKGRGLIRTSKLYEIHVTVFRTHLNRFVGILFFGLTTMYM